MSGCTISPLTFTMAIEVIIGASGWMVGGQRIRSGQGCHLFKHIWTTSQHLPQPRLVRYVFLRKHQENIKLAWMKIKPSRSRSISIIKGKLSDQSFYIGDEAIPTVSEKPVKSLGR